MDGKSKSVHGWLSHADAPLVNKDKLWFPDEVRKCNLPALIPAVVFNGMKTQLVALQHRL